MPAMIEEFQEAWEELTAPGAQFATTTIDVRGVPIKVFESALPSMRTVWELARGYADRDYIVERTRGIQVGMPRLIQAGVRYSF